MADSTAPSEVASIEQLASLNWLTSGGLLVGFGRLATAVVVVFLAFVAARLVRSAIERFRGRPHVSAAFLYIVEKLSGYALVAAGFLVALSTLGINLTSLAVFAGAVGVGVGLGLQGIVREFVSGLVVIFDRNINVGDFIELENGVRGEIVEVGPRASRIRTNDAVDVVLPNSKLIENQVSNWTLRGETRRIHIPFTVPNGSDKARVRDAVLEAARSVPFTVPDTDTRRTQVWLVGFGESYLNVELVVWPRPEAVRRPAAMQAAYSWAIDDALCRADIGDAYPQLEVRLRSIFGHEGDQALEALSLRHPEPRVARAASPSGTNDAAEDAQVDAAVADPEGRKPLDPSPEAAPLA